MADTVVPQVAGAATAAPIEGAPAAKPDFKKDLAELGEFSRKERDKLRKQTQERAERQAIADENARLRAENARLATLEKEAENPLEFLAKRGVPARAIGDEILNQGKPETKIAALEAKLREREERDRQRDEQEAQARARAQQAAQQSAAEEKLLSQRDAIKGDLPRVGKMTREKLLREYMVTYNDVAEHPETAPYVGTYSDEDILRATEVRLAEKAKADLEDYEAEELERVLTERKARASTEAGSSSAATAPAGQGSNGAAGRAKALSNAVASESSGSWKPENWDKLSDKAQNAILTDRIRKKLPLD